METSGNIQNNSADVQGTIINEQMILQSLRKILHAIDTHIRKVALAYDLTGPQLVCLMAIAHKKTISATEIAEEMSLHPSNIVGILDRLENRGFVTKKRSDEDRRFLQVSLTPASEKIIESMPYPLWAPLNSAFSNMTDEEIAQVVSAFVLLTRKMGIENESKEPVFKFESISQALDSI